MVLFEQMLGDNIENKDADIKSFYTIKDNVLYLNEDFDDELKPILIGGITYYDTIVFHDSYNKPIRHGTIPYGIKKIILGRDFNQELNLPRSVKYLRIGKYYEGPIPNGINKLYVPESYVLRNTYDKVKKLAKKIYVYDRNFDFDKKYYIYNKERVEEDGEIYYTISESILCEVSLILIVFFLMFTMAICAFTTEMKLKPEEINIESGIVYVKENFKNQITNETLMNKTINAIVFNRYYGEHYTDINIPSSVERIFFPTINEKLLPNIPSSVKSVYIHMYAYPDIKINPDKYNFSLYLYHNKITTLESIEPNNMNVFDPVEENYLGKDKFFFRKIRTNPYHNIIIKIGEKMKDHFDNFKCSSSHIIDIIYEKIMEPSDLGNIYLKKFRIQDCSIISIRNAITMIKDVNPFMEIDQQGNLITIWT